MRQVHAMDEMIRIVCQNKLNLYIIIIIMIIIRDNYDGAVKKTDFIFRC